MDERDRLQVRLIAAVGVHDLRTRRIGEAPLHDSVDRAGELVLPHRVGEGELHLGRQMPLVAAAGGIGVAEAVVRRDRVSSRDVRAHAVEDHPAGLVGVEAPVQEALQVATALRVATPEGESDRAAHRVLGRVVVLQERDQVTRRGEAEGEHDRVLGREDEFERCALIVRRQERMGAIDAHGGVVEIRPGVGRNGDAVDQRPADELRVVVHHHVSLALVQCRRVIRQREVSAGRVVEDLLDDHLVDDRTAVGILGDRQRRSEPIGRGADDRGILPA